MKDKTAEEGKPEKGDKEAHLCKVNLSLKEGSQTIEKEADEIAQSFEISGNKIAEEGYAVEKDRSFLGYKGECIHDRHTEDLPNELGYLEEGLRKGVERTEEGSHNLTSSEDFENKECYANREGDSNESAEGNEAEDWSVKEVTNSISEPVHKVNVFEADTIVNANEGLTHSGEGVGGGST